MSSTRRSSETSALLRKSVGQFEGLLGQLASRTQRERTNYHKPIDPEQRLAVSEVSSNY